MRNATMFIVGMLMIASLVGLGASAGAPAEFEEEMAIGTRAMEQDPEDDEPECPPQPKLPNVVNSWGLRVIECNCPTCPLPPPGPDPGPGEEDEDIIWNRY